MNTKKIFKHTKRGIIDAQFNWIFILVAGVVILLFIISIVISQKKNSDTQSAILAIKQINTILKGKEQSENTYSLISIPQTKLEFRCDKETLLFNFKIENSERVNLPTQIVFAPREISTSRIQVWSESFDTGFHVNNMLYISTQSSIILIYNTSPNVFSKELYELIPGNFSRAFISSDTQFSDYRNRKIICTEIGTSSDCPNPNTDYIKIIPQNTASGLEIGKVVYYRSGLFSEAVPYYSKAMLLGAIFSDNSEYYSCQILRTLDQFEVKRSLTQKRLELLSNDTNIDCQMSIDIANDLYIKSLEDLQFEYFNFTYMRSAVQNLETSNMDLTLGGCPKIY